MWTVLFGDHEEAENEPADAAAATSAAAVKTRALSPEAPTAPVTPVASPEPLVAAVDPHVSAPIEVKYGNRREESEDSAMAMLLKRLNNLMVKVGQHEFEKKTLVDQVSLLWKMMGIYWKIEREIGRGLWSWRVLGLSHLFFGVCG